MTKDRVSIKDIAEATGVSHPTVSRALRGRGRVSTSTRKRIVAKAQEMGYTPSMVARGLVTQRSLAIGMVVTTFSDPFHSEIVQGVESEALRHNYSIFLASTGVDADRELEVVRNFRSRHVDGIIVSSSRVGNHYAGQLQEAGIPIVLINSQAQGDNFHAINHNDYQGGCQLVQHLLARGHRNIAYLGNSRAGRADKERRRAWEDTMQGAGLEPCLAVQGPNGRLDGGVAGATHLLAQADSMGNTMPDAIYCYNDTMAIGALSVLRKRGLAIPRDVALTGFDDIDVAEFLEPPLTTLRQPRLQMGRDAMQLMLLMLDGEQGRADRPPIAKEITVEGKLIVRDST